VRYEESEWPTYKAEMPLGQIPVLEINGFKLPQSISIARYLAKQFHLDGKNNLEQAKADAVADTLTDLVNKFSPVLWEEDDDTKKKEGIDKFIAEELPKHVKNLETLGRSYNDGGHFFVGNSLTWVDLYVYDMAQNLLEIDDKLFDRYPWLKANREEVEKQPRIATYLKSRPKTPY
jgi:glutathione S-transferase